MAGKPKKAVAKKVPTKKARKAKVEVVEAELVPDLMHPEVMKQIAQMERAIECVSRMADAKLIESVRNCAKKAADFSNQAVQAGASALVHAWGCGSLLNATKEKLGHGAFGRWRDEHLLFSGFSERTSTRYMQLAARCHDVRGLLQWAPTLKQAYVECGILPEPAKREQEEDTGDGSDPEEQTDQKKEEEERQKEVMRKKEVLLASVSELQQKLRQGISIKKDLSKGELQQIRLARNQIDKFFEQILGSK